jgi:hypothetical protein
MRNEQEPPAASPPFEPASDQSERWFSKHGVQATVVEYLTQTGWRLRWVGDCVARDRVPGFRLVRAGEPIHDLDAEQDGVRLLVEAVGHPGSLDAGRDGQDTDRVGHPTQGRGRAFARYSDALLTGTLMRNRYLEARIVQAFPAHGLYCTHAPRAYGSPYMRARGVELWMVNKDGTVSEQAQT